MFDVTIDDSRFGAPLRALVEKLGSPTEVLDAIGHLLETNARNRAHDGIDPNGLPWQVWADSTRKGYPWFDSKTKERVEIGPGHGLLLDRYGKMLGGLNYQVTGDSVRVGFADYYASFHEWGTKNMDRRGLLMADPDAGTLGAADESAVLDLINNWLDKSLGA